VSNCVPFGGSGGRILFDVEGDRERAEDALKFMRPP
jgi:hypothetical protein